MEPSLSALGLKVVSPALRAGYSAVRHELARRPGAGPMVTLADVEDVVDEAVTVLAGDSNDLLGAFRTGAKALLSRPSLFQEPVPRAWVRTEATQDSLKLAARAAIRGEDDAPHAASAIGHYRLFLVDGDEAPDPSEVYASALGFILASIRRVLDPGARAVLGAIHGVREDVQELRHELARDHSENMAEVDARVRVSINRLRARRFFRSADTAGDAAALASELIGGRLSRASTGVRGWALAWCARVLSSSDREVAISALATATSIGDPTSPEVRVARAFITSSDDVDASLRLLNPDGSKLDATAVLQIVRNEFGAQAALDRLQQAGLGLADLDADGRFSFLTVLVEAGLWMQARDVALALDVADFEQTPALLWIAGTVLVATSVPEDMRGFLLQDIPPNPAAFRLREDEAGLRYLRVARRLLRQAAEECRRLQLDLELAAAERYELWLGLQDPAASATSRDELRRRIDAAGQELRYLPLALAFGLEVDLGRAEDAVRRRAALGGSSDPVVGAAAIALLVDRLASDPTGAAEFFARQRALLAASLDESSMLALEVGVLTQVGRTDEARALLESANSSVPEELRARLASAVEGGVGEPSIATLEKSYELDPRTQTLEALVHRYLERDYEPRFLELARHLLAELPSRAIALRCLGYLVEQGRETEALELVEILGPMALEDADLALQSGWIRYRMGNLARAEEALEVAEAARDTDQTRALRFNLLVTAGRWEELDPFIEEQWQSRNDRSPLELVQCANLAARIQGRRVPDLIREAVARAPHDPHVLAAAYNAATTAGLEETIPEAGSWIMRAAEFSDEDGPVQTRSIQELLKDQPEWDSRVEEAFRSWARAEVPLVAVAGMLRRSWLDLQLTAMIGNRDEPRPSERRAVPLFSGRGRRRDSEARPVRTAALDRHAVTTMAYAGALSWALERLDRVYLPHGLLADMMEQRHRVAFHQPSKVAFAQRLLELLARGRLRRFEAVSAPDLELAGEVGRSRAELIVEAASQREGQHVVIHPYPITRVGSLLSEPVDLSRFTAHLCSCSAVLDALEGEGKVARPVLAAARAYLAGHDGRWPDEPSIEPGATLYLTDLAVEYLRFVGLLDRIVTAGFHVVVSASEVAEAEALRDVEERSEAVASVIDTVRRELASALAEGRAALDPAPVSTERLNGYPEETIALAERADVLVSDDRFLNQHSFFDHPNGRRPVLGSLELLEQLADEGEADASWLDDVRTRLRSAGVMLIGVDQGELSRFMAAAPAPEFRETAELRAIRESFRIAQKRGWFNPAVDAHWLVSVQNGAAGELVRLWSRESEHPSTGERASWLFRLMSSRDWAQSDVGLSMEGIARDGMVLDLAKLVSLHRLVAAEGRPAFARWLEQEVLNPLWEREPRLRELLAHHLRNLVASVAQDLVADRMGSDELTARQLSLLHMPEFMQLELLQEEAFRSSCGIELDATVHIGEADFTRSSFIRAAEQVYASPGTPRRLIDDGGRRWAMRTEQDHGDWPLLLSRGNLRYRTKGLTGVHPDPLERVGMLDARLARDGHRPAALEDWRRRLSAEPLDAAAAEALDQELSLLPGAVETAISESLEQGEASIQLLVPRRRSYWERLVGRDASDDLENHLASGVRPQIERIRASHARPDEWLLLLGSHPRILADGRFGERPTDAWTGLGRWVADVGDPMSKVAFVEVALPQAAKVPELTSVILTLVDQIEGLEPDDPEGSLNLLSSVAIFVDGELSRCGVLADWPPFRRRAATLAHAAMICRILVGAIETGRFAQFCIDQRGWQFMLQSLVDLRSEPRWRPDFLSAVQLRNEFIGRLVNAAGALAESELPDALQERLLGATGLRSRMNFPAVFWPGPLEGGVRLQPLPDGLAADIEGHSAHELPSSGALILIANAGAIFEIPSDLAERVVSRIVAEGPAMLASIKPERVYDNLLALAYLAASHRLLALADAVQVLARVNRQHVAWEAAAEVQLAMVCAASREDQVAWREFAGRWIRELAAAEADPVRDEALLAWAEALCEVDPSLRLGFGSAIAALRLPLGA